MKTLLIVEDDAELLNAMQIGLRNVDVSLYTADTVQKAIDLLETITPDLILLDIILPGSDGRDLLRHLQQKDSTIPVIIATNSSQTGLRQECMDLGATDCITKSETSLQGILSLVEKYLEEE